MGGANSVTNITKNLVESVSSTVINSIQNVANQTLQEQEINIDCNEFTRVMGPQVLKCQDNTRKFADKHGWSEEELSHAIQNQCNSLFVCGANHISMKGAMQVNLTQEQKSQISSDITQKIQDNLEQSASQSTGVLQFGDKTRNQLENTTKTVQKAVLNITNNLKNNFDQVQTLNIKGGNVSFVTFSTAQTVISDQLQENKVVMKSLTDLATTVAQDAKQSSGMGAIGKILVIIIVFIVGLLLILGLILWLLKKQRLSDSKKNSSRRTGIGSSRRTANVNN